MEHTNNQKIVNKLAVAIALSMPWMSVIAQVNSATQDLKLEEITVVARRVEENLQSVPMSVTRIGGEALEIRNIASGTDLQKLVPTLSVGVSIVGAEQQYSLRGVRSGVITYFNEVPINSAAVDQQLWDLESVQALAGPQGTLFGRNSTGGAMLFYPKKPDDNLAGSLQIGAGSYGLKEVTGILNVPVNDMLKLRLGAKNRERDGLVKNLSGPDMQSEDRQAYKFSALFTPLDTVSNYSVLSYSERDESPYAQISQSDGVAGCPANFVSCLYTDFLTGVNRYDLELKRQAERGVRRVDSPYDSVQKGTELQFSNILAVDIGQTTAKYIAGYSHSNNRHFQNQLSIPLPVIVGDNVTKREEISHELQLSGHAFADRLQWVTGVYYLDQEIKSIRFFQLFNPAGIPYSKAGSVSAGGDLGIDSLAYYAQGTWSFTDQLNLTLGLRRTNDKPWEDATAGDPAFVCALSPSLPSVDLDACVNRLRAETNATTYNLSMDYAVSDDVLLYATHRKGYNAGGFNPDITEVDLQVVDPEYIRDYEIGMKADWQIGAVPVRTNLSGYYASYEDIQRVTTLFYNGRVSTGRFNAAEATLYGGQLQLLARLTPQLDLSISYGYLHTQYDSFENELIGDRTGNVFGQAPQDTFDISLTYRQPMPTGELWLNAGYGYISEVTFADENINLPGSTQDGYGLVDLRADWRDIGNMGFDVGVYVKNATDKTYAYNANDRSTPFGFISNVYRDPRTVGIELKYSFGQ
ncbi:MAG: hypothetical protein VR73_09620 [Gammaproteobacteria bacterium BRH_c0]|nr:MAG: hypothetical protein VR73_09620 [Gammaproteobacteria bacterium BRH_c0]